MIFQQAYYLIRPNSSLKQRLDATAADWTCLLSEPAIWSRRESSEIRLPVSTWVVLREVQVKLLFMLEIFSEYFDGAESPSTDLQVFLRDLLDLPEIRVETFDKWWSLERFDGIENSYDDVESRLTKDLVRTLAIPSIEGALEWIDELKRSRQ